MFDNFSLIPDAAFTAMGSVANNLIDKVSNAVGFIFTPKGKWKDYEDAVSYFIDEIKSNESMPPLAKAASISKARKMLKEYINQNDVLQIAMNNLSENACPEKLNNDWLMFFMDKAKNIEGEDIKLIFGRLLAEECNSECSVSKALIETVAIMDKRSAESFNKLCKYVVKLISEDEKNEKSLFITSLRELEKHHISTSLVEIMDLSSLGLIEYEVFTGYSLIKEKIVIEYANTLLKLEKSGGIPIGYVEFTRKGLELANIILEEGNDEYLTEIEDYLQKKDVLIEKL